MLELSETLASLLETTRSLEEEMDQSSDVLDAVEGRRFLLRMLAASVDTYVEHSDSDRPVFVPAESHTRKMFADCPDTDYLRAPISTRDGATYRIRGRIPEGSLYVGILLYGKGGRIGNRLRDSDLTLDEGGRFEVLISTVEQSGDWLRADGDETAVLVRQYFGDRAAEAPIELAIERVGELPPPEPLGAQALTEQLAGAERMLRSIFRRTLQAQQLAKMGAVNQLIEIPAEKLFPTPDNTYRAGWFRLESDRRIRVRGKLPDARYFSLTLYNGWLESLDYTKHQISLNHRQLACDADGSFEVHLSDRDPGVDNWLDVAGHREGFLVARTLLGRGEAPPLDMSVIDGG